MLSASAKPAMVQATLIVDAHHFSTVLYPVEGQRLRKAKERPKTTPS
jgi:hypothetical protein